MKNDLVKLFSLKCLSNFTLTLFWTSNLIAQNKVDNGMFTEKTLYLLIFSRDEFRKQREIESFIFEIDQNSRTKVMKKYLLAKACDSIIIMADLLLVSKKRPLRLFCPRLILIIFNNDLTEKHSKNAIGKLLSVCNLFSPRIQHNFSFSLQLNWSSYASWLNFDK